MGIARGASLGLVDVTVEFGDQRAVDAVTAEVGAGEVLAVLGPSGSGKSTLLRAIAGLQPIDAGTVRIDGADVAPLAPHRRGIGLMFQSATLFPHRDVAGNVGFGLRMAGVPKDERAARVAELLELVGLPGHEKRAVSTLSGGEQQRVALARTLAPSPRLLLLDEPFGALDAELRARLVEDVGRLVRRLGLTVVAVTHDREEAYALADRVMVLRDGRVAADGTPESLWSAPADAWIAGFLGMPNVMRAEIRPGADGPGTAVTAWGEVPVAAGARGSHVVIPPEAVRVDRSGPAEAVVVARAFLGDRVRLVLRSDRLDAELVAVVPVAGAPVQGADVRITLAPSNPLPTLP